MASPLPSIQWLPQTDAITAYLAPNFLCTRSLLLNNSTRPSPHPLGNSGLRRTSALDSGRRHLFHVLDAFTVQTNPLASSAYRPSRASIDLLLLLLVPKTPTPSGGSFA
uniref:Uncharacterized protein n=1 Tax=Steinernema glaseri TaxID=37863 RepID=A0A1I7ZFC8_9BILA